MVLVAIEARGVGRSLRSEHNPAEAICLCGCHERTVKILSMRMVSPSPHKGGLGQAHAELGIVFRFASFAASTLAPVYVVKPVLESLTEHPSLSILPPGAPSVAP